MSLIEKGLIRTFRIQNDGAGFDAAYADCINTLFRWLHEPKVFSGKPWVAGFD